MENNNEPKDKRAHNGGQRPFAGRKTVRTSERYTYHVRPDEAALFAEIRRRGLSPTDYLRHALRLKEGLCPHAVITRDTRRRTTVCAECGATGVTSVAYEKYRLFQGVPLLAPPVTYYRLSAPRGALEGFESLTAVAVQEGAEGREDALPYTVWRCDYTAFSCRWSRTVVYDMPLLDGLRLVSDAEARLFLAQFAENSHVLAEKMTRFQ